ncbi:hypothetical protein ACFLZB_03075 [Nanoarchaeota archaeon]
MRSIFLIQGFLIKLLTGGDDVLVQIPLLGTLFKRRSCKINFLIGTFFSLGTVLVLSILFASLLKKIPYAHYISAGLLVILAILVYFNLLLFKPKFKQQCQVLEEKVKRNINLQALAAGFIAFFITAIDDAIIYSSVLLKPLADNLYVIIGILIAFSLEVILIFYFSKHIAKLKYTKQITTLVLLTLAVLVAFQVI